MTIKRYGWADQGMQEMPNVGPYVLYDDALATPAPDAVQEAAMVLLADGVAMQTLVDFQLRHSATASAKARSMRHVQMKAALRAIRARGEGQPQEKGE